MTLEQEVILSLLKSEITDTEIILPQECEKCDWKAVLTESRKQAVTLMLFDAIKQIKDQVPQAVYDKCYTAACRITVNNTRVAMAQNELVKLLNDGAYPYVILKGEAAASFYPKPEVRALGDVDFLIDPAQKEAIGQKLIAAGYQSSQEGHVCHVVYKKPGAHLEMHYEIAGIPNGSAGDKIRAFMKDAVHTAHLKNNGQGDFCAPQDIYHGLILLLHMQHHMLGEGLGLRHLCDWACFVNKTHSEPFWEEKLIPFLSEIGLFTFAAVMTKTCAAYLGVPCPAWADSVEQEVCQEVMSDILSGGNFGVKDSTRRNSGKMVSNHGKDGTGHGKVYYLYHILQASIIEQHPEVKQKPYLYPIHFVYRTMRYGVMVLVGKRQSIHKAIPQANKRKAIYDKLHVFEVVENERKI